MKVILNQDIKGIGKKLQTVEVSEGYARNYLIPRKLASACDSKSVSEANSKKEAIAFRKSEDLKAANESKEILEKRYIEFKHKVGENGKLFGSITEKEIADEIEKVFGLKIDKKKITLRAAIKNVGSYSAEIKLYESVVANLKINVVRL
ncbi:MAG: 50S ribosomal protein L9 [Clostridia bacterium]|nr:50S ribosomal protein L9 [Clostridia bacterium]